MQDKESQIVVCGKRLCASCKYNFFEPSRFEPLHAVFSNPCSFCPRWGWLGVSLGSISLHWQKFCCHKVYIVYRVVCPARVIRYDVMICDSFSTLFRSKSLTIEMLSQENQGRDYNTSSRDYLSTSGALSALLGHEALSPRAVSGGAGYKCLSCYLKKPNVIKIFPHLRVWTFAIPRARDCTHQTRFPRINWRPWLSLVCSMKDQRSILIVFIKCREANCATFLLQIACCLASDGNPCRHPRPLGLLALNHGVLVEMDILAGGRWSLGCCYVMIRVARNGFRGEWCRDGQDRSRPCSLYAWRPLSRLKKRYDAWMFESSRMPDCSKLVKWGDVSPR